MSIFIWIILGALAGWLASIVTGDNARMGALANIVVGILGAFIGGAIVSSIMGWEKVSGFNLYSILVSMFGAVVLLWIIKKIRKN